MEVRFRTNRRGRRFLEIDDARIVFPNFEGREEDMNRKGDRNFLITIPNDEIADALINDVNEDGAGWNVTIKPSKIVDEPPYMNLKVKFKVTEDRCPAVWLDTNGRRVKMPPDLFHKIDEQIIRGAIYSADINVSAYDNFTSGKHYRTAYLDSICLYQEADRFDRLAESEYPEE